MPPALGPGSLCDHYARSGRVDETLYECRSSVIRRAYSSFLTGDEHSIAGIRGVPATFLLWSCVTEVREALLVHTRWLGLQCKMSNKLWWHQQRGTLWQTSPELSWTVMVSYFRLHAWYNFQASFLFCGLATGVVVGSSIPSEKPANLETFRDTPALHCHASPSPWVVCSRLNQLHRENGAGGRKVAKKPDPSLVAWRLE